MQLIFLIIGFFMLIKGADVFVENASGIARTFNIPPIIIGLTIVALGTSAPEIAVSLSSAFKGSADIALGNVIGSNIMNLLVIAGITSVISPIMIEKKIIKKEYPFLIVATFAIFFLSADMVLSGEAQNMLTVSDGLMLLLIFSIFIYSLVGDAISSQSEEPKDVAAEQEAAITLENAEAEVDLEEAEKQLKKGKLKKIATSSVLIVISVIAIVLGSNLAVNASVTIARAMGLSEALIGLTIIALGTSLPELVTCVVAATKGENSLAMGNIIGSNIYNTLFVLGPTAIISPVVVSSKIVIDMIFLIGATLLVYVFIMKQKLSRVNGLTMIVVYIAYIVYAIIRN